MATQINRRQTVYGYPNPQAGLQQEPLVFQRDPTAQDAAEFGTIWVNTVAGTFFICSALVVGTGYTWAATTGGATTLASLTVNPGNATVTAGDLTVTAGDFTVSAGTATVQTLVAGATTINGAVDITGNTTMNGDLALTGALAITGDFDVTDVNSITITSTHNGAGAIALIANGGVNETILIQSQQGTGAGAIFIDAIDGGVDITGGEATANAINMHTTNAAGGINIGTGTGGFNVTSANGDINLASGTGEVNVGRDAVAHDITIGNIIGASSVAVAAGTGGMLLITNGTGNMHLESGNQMLIESVDTGIFQVTGALQDATVQSTAGSVNIIAAEAAIDAIALSTTDPAGGLSIETNGIVSVEPALTSEASPTAAATSDFRVIVSTFTGFTTAAAGIQDFTINSADILTTSGIFVSVANLNASTNAAVISKVGVTQAGGSVVVHTQNNGVGALGAGDDVIITLWIIS